MSRVESLRLKGLKIVCHKVTNRLQRSLYLYKQRIHMWSFNMLTRAEAEEECAEQ